MRLCYVIELGVAVVRVTTEMYLFVIVCNALDLVHSILTKNKTSTKY